MTSLQERKIKQTGCDVRFDNLTRQLYATDASIYQIEPIGVVVPRHKGDVQAVIEVANDDLKLKPGMTANVSVVIAHRDEALKISNAALPPLH